MSIWSRISEVISTLTGSLSEFIQRIGTGTSEPPEASLAFTIGMIALGAKMAKADGIVTGDEVKAFKDVFKIPPEELGNVARVFNLAKQDVAGFEFYAREVARLFSSKHEILEDVLDGLFHIAKSDGLMHERELVYLERVAEIFGFEKRDFAGIKSRHLTSAPNDPYAILGIEPSASDADLKSRYRKLVRDNHPDRHIAAGVPQELIVIATERLASINSAYDAIAKERGI